MGVNMLALLLMTQLFGVQIHNPNPDKIEIVRTSEEPARNHHAILDDPQYAHLMPWMVTIKVHEKAVHTLTVVFTAVMADGSSRDFGRVQTMPPGQMMIQKYGSAAFWPGGWMPVGIPGNPIMSESPVDWANVQSMTFHIDYIEWEDGSIDGPDARDTRGQIERHKRHEENMRKRRGQ